MAADGPARETFGDVGVDLASSVGQELRSTAVLATTRNSPGSSMAKDIGTTG